MDRVLIERRAGRKDRVKRGGTPAVVLGLMPNQTLLSFEIREAPFVSAKRKTTDWLWTACVATRVEDK